VVTTSQDDRKQVLDFTTLNDRATKSDGSP
jgi:hypothetical protein